MKKNLFVFFAWLCIAAMVLSPIRADAAQKGNIIQDVEINEDDMQLLCVDSAGNGEYEIQLGGQTVESVCENVEEAQTPVTVFCLVDTSGSISEFKTKLLQDTLSKLSEYLGEEDSMVIATVDDQLNIGEELCTAQEREAAIAGITSSHKDTDLYMGIVESLDKLSSDETYNSCRCLVVLSDGIDDQDDGMTEQEVLQAVQSARRPVYTVALVENPNEREGAKVLGSFARNSYGGLHLTTVDEGVDKPIRSDVTGAEFGEKIWTSLMTTAVVTADLTETEIDTTKSEVRLCVTYKAANSAYEDYVDLHTSEFTQDGSDEKEQDQKDSKKEDSKEKTSKENDSEEDSEIDISEYLWIIIVAAALLLIVVIVIIVIVVKKKKAKKAAKLEQEKMELDVVEDTTAVKEPLIRECVDVITPTEPEQPQKTPKQEEPDMSGLKKYKVYMTDIPYGKRSWSFMIYENQQNTFGRDRRAMNILNGEDTHLSGVHFSIMVRNGMYGVRDENSSNGTFLNGVSITGKGWTKFQSTDKIRAGGYEYRVIIEEQK